MMKNTAQKPSGTLVETASDSRFGSLSNGNFERNLESNPESNPESISEGVPKGVVCASQLAGRSGAPAGLPAASALFSDVSFSGQEPKTCWRNRSGRALPRLLSWLRRSVFTLRCGERRKLPVPRDFTLIPAILKYRPNCPVAAGLWAI